MMGSTDLVAVTLQTTGALFLLYTGATLLYSASLWLLPPVKLTRYQRPNGAWALVTGASAGIGFGTAQELAARGFNVILLGHLVDELEDAKASILAEFPSAQVRIIVMDAIIASAADIEAMVHSISSLPLTILVNNVGGLAAPHPKLRPLDAYAAPAVDATLDLNIRFMTHLTRLLLPALARGGGPALVLSLSSVARDGMPLVAIYSGCKAYVAALSAAVGREARAAGQAVDTLAVVPGDVRTPAHAVALAPGSPDGRAFAAAMLDRAGRAVARGYLVVTPWWAHAVQVGLMAWVPERVALPMVLAAFRLKVAANERLEGERTTKEKRT